jgi:excisionase family DNA binding protein
MPLRLILVPDVARTVLPMPGDKREEWMKDLVVTREEAAEVLRLSLRTVDKLLAAGQIVARRVGRRVLIPRAEIERFAGGHAAGGSAQNKRAFSE